MRRLFPFAVALSLLVLLTGSQFGIAAAQPPGLAKAIAAQEKHNPLLLSLAGVAGSGVGVDASGAAVIRVYVETHGVGVPAALDNVPVERVVTGRFYASSCAQTFCPRPVPLGVSTGHPAITAGTIAARVKDASGLVYALSNNHVYANSNNASIGDGALQPGPYDGGTDPGDRIGTLAAFKEINFSGGDNDIDAAIALSSTAMLGNSTLSGYTPTSTPVEGTLNLPVKKEGRTTGVTLGQISEVNVTVTVCYAAIGPFCVQAARYVNQFAIGGGTFSAGGDSGSLIVTQSGNNPVGLLFAGSSTRTIANRIQAVLAWFDVTIDSASGSTNNSPTASFTSACTGLMCNLDGTGSSDTDGTIQNYAWNFGDGNTASGPGATVSHSYATGGSYTVTLTVSDNGGATGQTSHSVSVSSGGSINLTVVGYKTKNGLEKADLTWSPSGTSVNVDVRRNSALLTTTADDGAYTDNINKRGAGSYTYQVCEAGTSTCSNVVTITF
jgi:PKD repeat protein